MAKDLASAIEQISNSNSRYDNVEKQQEVMVQHQAAGFDKLERILKSLTASCFPVPSPYRGISWPPLHVGEQNVPANSPWLPQNLTSPTIDFLEEPS